jgi:hypothetical protein
MCVSITLKRSIGTHQFGGGSHLVIIQIAHQFDTDRLSAAKAKHITR